MLRKVGKSLRAAERLHQRQVAAARAREVAAEQARQARAAAQATGSQTVASTSYCDSGTTASGEQTHAGVVAMNTVPLYTRVRVDSGPFAGSILTVLDHIGYGSEFDIWQASCSSATEYGSQTITISVLN